MPSTILLNKLCHTLEQKLVENPTRFLTYASPLANLSKISNVTQNTFTNGDEEQHKNRNRALRVAVIGCPNVGKSALTNALVRSPVCPVSKLIDTTRTNTMTALTEDECQLVVVDSPGLISLSHAKGIIGTHTEDRVLTDPEKAIERAEQILVVQDASARGQFIQHRVLYMLQRYSHVPACLILNKIDLIERRSELMELTHTLTEGMVGGRPMQRPEQIRIGMISSIIEKAKEQRGEKADPKLGLCPTGAKRDEKWHILYNKLLHKPAHKASWSDTLKLFKDQIGWPHFNAVFHISAKTGEGVDALREYLRQNAVERRWAYQPQLISKKDPKRLCCEHVRSTLMNELPSYIAYKLRVGVAEWEVDEQQGRASETLRIAVNIFCDKIATARRVWYCLDKLERGQREHFQQLFNSPVIFRILIRVDGLRGVYLGDEQSAKWALRRREEAKQKAKDSKRIMAEIRKENANDTNG